jgi:5-formyltetrahydrofolate cyclo-ligase
MKRKQQSPPPFVPREYSSPACFMHEIESGEELSDVQTRRVELTPAPCSQGWDAIRAWRRQMRESLINYRLGLPLHVRAEQGERAKRLLREQLKRHDVKSIGLYWPMRGEVDVRDLARECAAAGIRVGLPVVVEKAAPVEFWHWEPGMRMSRGIWHIPIPSTREIVEPEMLIVPLVGFDPSKYRLGYGGGYYDRTLAATKPRPLCIGLGYEAAQLPTICPQPHDVPMDIIITDR